MKKLVLSCFFCLLVSYVLGQGFLDFHNDQGSLVYTNALAVGGTRGLTETAPGKFFYGLFLAPVGTSDPLLFTFTSAYATNTAQAGRYDGGRVSIMWPSGQSMLAQVRGWSSDLGRDWSLIQSQKGSGQWFSPGFYGESAILTLVNDPIPPSTFSVGSFDLYVVPEPSTIALAGMCLLILGVLRPRCRS